MERLKDNTNSNTRGKSNGSSFPRLITVGIETLALDLPAMIEKSLSPTIPPVSPSLSTGVTSESPSVPKESSDSGYGKLTLFLFGLLLGSVCETFTIFMMLFIGVIFNNQPLPALLGSVTPQELLVTIVKNFVRSIITLVTRETYRNERTI